MKFMKILLGIVCVLAVVVGGVLFWGLSDINNIVKKAVETVGPQVTHTRVNLNAADIQLTEGRGVLSGLSIGNPAGFSSANLFAIDKIVLDVDPASVLDGIIVIDEITLDGARLIAEHKNVAETNIQALLKGMKGSSATSEPAATSEDTGNEIRLIVKKLKVINNELSLMSEKLGNYTLPLPAIEQNNIGDPAVGLTPEQLGSAILKPILRNAEKTVKAKLETLAKDELKTQAEDKLKEKLGDKISEDDQQTLKDLKGMFGK